MFLASVGAPEGYVEAFSGYAKKKKKRERLKKISGDARMKTHH